MVQLSYSDRLSENMMAFLLFVDNRLQLHCIYLRFGHYASMWIGICTKVQYQHDLVLCTFSQIVFKQITTN